MKAKVEVVTHDQLAAEFRKKYEAEIRARISTMNFDEITEKLLETTVDLGAATKLNGLSQMIISGLMRDFADMFKDIGVLLSEERYMDATALVAEMHGAMSTAIAAEESINAIGKAMHTSAEAGT